MNILHVVAGIQETCGVSCFVMETARAQMAHGHCVRVVTSMTCGYPIGNVDVRLTDTPEEVDFQPDIVHLHSLWSLYVHRMAVWCRRKGIPYVISPHGTLTRWALHYKWWKKLPAMLLYQYRDLRHANGFHVTVEAEEADVRRLRLKQPIVVAPLGVAIQPEQSKDIQHKDILFLGRIHPVKNLDGLLKAWQRIPAVRRLGWRIVITGPDDIGYQAELKSLAVGMGLRVWDFSKELAFGKKQIHGGAEVPLDVYQQKLASSHADVIFTGPVYSESKDWLYRQSRFFVLPSHSENFGAVILEALAAGTPCLASRGTPWRQLEEHQCGWWMDDSNDDIAMALGHAMSMGEADYVGMCKRARQFVVEQYSWNMTAQKLNQLYSHV